MPTIVLSPRQTDDSQALWQAAISRGWGVHRLATWRITEDARSVADPFLYVEALFGPMLAQELGLRLLDPPEDWLCRLPMGHRRREVRACTLAAARELPEPAFVKPPNDKSFPAAIYPPGGLPTGYDPEMTVLVAEPVVFTSEFRCFVLDRQVRAFSLYARSGGRVLTEDCSREESAELAAFTSALLLDEAVELPRACVLDCGPIEGRGWAAVELNAAWGAGLYSCDPAEVLEVVQAASYPVLNVPL